MKELHNKLHIVAFDIPYPADYGGVIDIFHKIQALKNEGVSITLHMFQYGRKRADEELTKYCDTIDYYKRSTYKNPFIGSKPYIVNSRNSEQLLTNLCEDNAPILFEGLHCTYFLNDPKLKNRFKVVRTHNIEHHYYKQLEKSEIRYFKKYFFRIEAEKLRKYESILKHADLVISISPNDQAYLSKRYKNVTYIPAFHSNNEMHFPGEKGNYLLYHGNLAVPENYLAAMQLVNEVFSKVEQPCIIAGNNPPKELEKLVEKYDNITIQSNISTETIHELIKNAHINVLYTNQNTGIKLKLLNALYRGKFAIVNNLMVDGTGLENVCVVAKNFDEIVAKIREYSMLEYSTSYFENRKAYMESHFGNSTGAKKLIKLIQFDNSAAARRKKDNSLIQNLSQFSSILSYFSL
jgi:hypothetical protein